MSCKRGFTIPGNGDFDDGVGECEHCACTSYHTSIGRPWGPKHRHWMNMVQMPFMLTASNRVTQETLDSWNGIENELREHLRIQEQPS